MGVQGLTSFVEDNGHILKDVQFRNSKLVIDGCNLYHCLYYAVGLDQIHGGDYDSFAALINRFIKALRSCGIEPCVVLDGGTDYTDKKFGTLIQRAEEKIRTAHNMSMGHKGNILPPIIKKVITEVLTSLKVPFAKCTAEADQEIASLANEWNCPVLSNDGDFFIFDIPAGVLPLSHFQWQQDTSNRFIPAKHFTTARFCSRYNINRPLLPVFAAVAGNDYIKLSSMGLTLQWAKYSPLSGRFARLDGLLRWLGDFQTQQDALEAMFRIIGDCNRHKMDDIRRGLSVCIEEYKLPQSSLGGYFAQGTPPRNLPEPVKVLPDWALFSLTQGKFASIFLDVLLFKRVILSANVEDASLPSGNITSRPIRQVMYGLLLGPGSTGSAVEEYHRDGLELTSHMVQPVTSGAAQQLQLETMNEEPQSVRLQVLLETLGVTLGSQKLSGVPPHLRLPVSVTCYWLSHAQPPPALSLLQALLLGMVYGEFCRQKRSQRGVSREESVLERLKGLGGRSRRKGPSLDLGVAHAFSQWQTCLREAVHLNQLLCFPLPEPHCAGLYRGTLVHQLVAKLGEATTPDSLLAGGRGSGQLYQAMLDTVLSQDSPSRLSSTTRRGKGSPCQPMVDLPADLQKLALELEEEEEEDGRRRKMKGTPEEDQSWIKVSVKTRYRTKDRGQRVQNPELSRKQERKQWI